MSKLAVTLKEEITRLGRKEARRATGRLKSRLTLLERTVREQRTTLAALTRQLTAFSGRLETAGARAPAKPAGDGARLSPRLIKALRTRLKLTRSAFGRLTGVSHVAVYLWESGQSKPKEATREAILSLRGLGVREVRRRLGEQATAPAAGRAPRRAPARRKVAKRAARRRS